SGPLLVQAFAMPSGTMGYGSTSSAGTLTVTDTTGAPILARIDVANTDRVSPSLTTGTYALSVAHPSTAAGANDFYVLKIFRGMDNPVVAPGDMTTPGMIAMMDQGMNQRQGFVLAHLAASATDYYYSFPVLAGDHVVAFCGARTGGSGVIDLNVHLLQMDGTT